MSTSWVSGGNLHIVTSVQNEGETPEEFTARHLAAVRYDLTHGFPID